MSGHMRLPPHVPFQGRYRPGHSAHRFSPAGLSVEVELLGAVASRNLRSADLAHSLSKLCEVGIGLTRGLDVRVSPAEKNEIQPIAEAAGLSVAELERGLVFGGPVVALTTATTIRELPSLGGLLNERARRGRWRAYRAAAGWMRWVGD